MFNTSSRTCVFILYKVMSCLEVHMTEEKEEWFAGVKTAPHVQVYACYPGSDDDESVVDPDKPPTHTSIYAAMGFRFTSKELAQKIALNLQKGMGRGQAFVLNCSNAFGPNWTKIEPVEA